MQIDIDADPDHPLDAAVFDGVPNLKAIKWEAGRITLGLNDLARDTPAVLQALAARGVIVRHIGSDRANLEDVFLEIMRGDTAPRQVS